MKIIGNKVFNAINQTVILIKSSRTYFGFTCLLFLVYCSSVEARTFAKNNSFTATVEKGWCQEKAKMKIDTESLVIKQQYDDLKIFLSTLSQLMPYECKLANELKVIVHDPQKLILTANLSKQSNWQPQLTMAEPGKKKTEIETKVQQPLVSKSIETTIDEPEIAPPKPFKEDIIEGTVTIPLQNIDEWNTRITWLICIALSCVGIKFLVNIMTTKSKLTFQEKVAVLAEAQLMELLTDVEVTIANENIQQQHRKFEYIKSTRPFIYLAALLLIASIIIGLYAYLIGPERISYSDAKQRAIEANKKNNHITKELYTKALMKENYPWAFAFYAQMFNEKGDKDQYLHYLNKAADLGSRKALLELGMELFGRNYADEKKRKKGIIILTKIINDGGEHAQTASDYIGIIYNSNEKYSKAFPFLKKCTQTKNSTGKDVCSFSLAMMYIKGLGVKKSHVEAFKYYHQAAELGHSDAQVNLGVSYYKGRGVAINLNKAKKWWTKAAAQGNEQAKKNLKVLASKRKRQSSNRPRFFNNF